MGLTDFDPVRLLNPRALVRAAACATALVGVLFTSGCSGTPADGPSVPTAAHGTPGVSANPEDEPVLSSPLQKYRLTMTELATISRARSILIGQCVERFGFKAPELEPFSTFLSLSIAGERNSISRIYGVTDRDQAAEYGYGVDLTDTPPVEDLGSQGDAYLLVLKGKWDPNNPYGSRTDSPGEVDGQPIPAGGCAGEASRAMGYDPDISAYGLAHNLWIEGQSQLQASDAYREVVSDWVACLGERGYHVTDPLNDQGDIKRSEETRLASDDNKPAPGEVELALADVDCKEKVDLVVRLNEAGSRIDRSLIEEHQLALEEDRKRLDEQLEKATALVEDQEQ